MKYFITLLIGAALAFGGTYVVSEMSHEDDHHGEDSHHDDELVAREPVRADGSFTIATSFYPLQFALEQIAGENAEIINIGAGRDPHDFRPSVQAMRTLSQADLVVLQGADFEPWGDEVKARLQADRVPVLLATANLTLREGGHAHDEDHADEHEDDHADEAAPAHDHEESEQHHDDHEAEGEHHDEHEEDGGHGHEDETRHHDDEHDHAHGAFNPHTWLDPVLFSETVEHLAEALTTLDPENAVSYAENAAALKAELTALDTTYETRLQSCTLDEVITSHAAFSYLGERYNFTIHSIAGLSTQDQPSATTLATLREEAAEGINTILLEENSIAAYGETLARETGLQTLSINPIAFSIPEGTDYLTLMQANLDTFATALNCND